MTKKQWTLLLGVVACVLVVLVAHGFRSHTQTVTATAYYSTEYDFFGSAVWRGYKVNCGSVSSPSQHLAHSSGMGTPYSGDERSVCNKALGDQRRRGNIEIVLGLVGLLGLLIVGLVVIRRGVSERRNVRESAR